MARDNLPGPPIFVPPSQVQEVKSSHHIERTDFVPMSKGE